LGRLLFAVAASAALIAPGVAHAAGPRATVQGKLDPSLREAIQQAIGETDQPIENRFEARRRARAAAEDAIAVLRSEGYYAYEVSPEVSDEQPPRPVVEITPGPQFHIADPTVTWQGDAPDPETQASARQAMDLRPGEPGRAARVVAAEGRIVAAVQKRGYADASAQPREVIVDHADDTVRPTYRISAGQLVRLDDLDLAQATRTNPAWLRRLAPWVSGDRYDPDKVAELERRLLDTGVYDADTESLAPREKTSADGLRPVVVSLSPRPPRAIEASASYSTAEGPGVNARWTHYNRLRRADTLALYGQLSDRDSRVGVELSLPHWRRAGQTLKTQASVYRLETDAYNETGAGVSADVTRRYGKTSYVTAGVSADVTRTDELTAATLTTLGRDLVRLAVLGDVLLDRSNDPLDPTSGWRLSARLEPTMILGDTTLPYLRAVAQGTYYQPLDKQAATVVAGRLRVGRIINGQINEIPASQRFYAGGGGSVRGFPYPGVGPRLADGTPRGGVSLVEGSLEVRRDITEKWGVAVFVDAGAVGSGGVFEVSDLAAGAGIGIRYNLGFAPIRVDIATPVMRRRGEAPFQVYLSIGQSF
jgi:translocation and assembly module TamA